MCIILTKLLLYDNIEKVSFGVHLLERHDLEAVHHGNAP